jgi:hypothetical protein
MRLGYAAVLLVFVAAMRSLPARADAYVELLGAFDEIEARLVRSEPCLKCQLLLEQERASFRLRSSLYARFQPNVKAAVGLKDYFEYLDGKMGVRDLDGLVRLYGGVAFGTMNGTLPEVFGSFKFDTRQPRYLYSPRWGWIDTAHLAATALVAGTLDEGRVKFKGHQAPFGAPQGVAEAAALAAGEALEIDQDKRGTNSGYSYEDLPSDLLGAYFDRYRKSEGREKQPFLSVYRQFLVDLGCVEKPLEIAPNRGTLVLEDDESGLRKDTPKESLPRINREFAPVYVLAPRNAPIDADIEGFRQEYLNSMTRGLARDKVLKTLSSRHQLER